jgi:hypothetical protein
MSKFFAGIGSRDTPLNILEQMAEIALKLSNLNYTLRSGHAGGADLAFEKSALKAEIWLPWSRFNYNNALVIEGHIHNVLAMDDEEAFESVARLHPMPSNLSQGAFKLMARNYRQIIGKNAPNSEFVVCYTKDGKASGGTGQAIRIAVENKIPVYNLYHDGIYEFCLAMENNND